MAAAINVSAFSLAGRKLAEVSVPSDISTRTLAEELGKAAAMPWDALQLTRDGEKLGDPSTQPFLEESAAEVALEVVLKAQPHELDADQIRELLTALQDPLDGFQNLNFALGGIQRLSLGAKDEDSCLRGDLRGDASSCVLTPQQLDSLARAALDQRLVQCTALCLRGVLETRPMMGGTEARRDSDALVALVSQMTQLTSLDLSGNRLGYANCRIDSLAGALPKLQKLTNLNLSCNGFFSFHGGAGHFPEHVPELLTSLLHLENLEILDLHLNDKAFVRSFSKEKELAAAYHLQQLLSKLRSLKQLIFFENDVVLSTVADMEAAKQPGCDIDFGLEDHVAAALRALEAVPAEGAFRPPLLQIPGVGRPVRAAYYFHLGRSLAASDDGLRQHVAKVDLSGGKLGRSWQGLTDLVLPRFPSLRELDLTGTSINLEFMKALQQPVFASLSTLNLADCCLCHFTNIEDDPTMVQPLLFWAESLTDLDLSNTFISEYGDFSPGHLQANLPALLRGLKILKRFSLSRNDIGDTGEQFQYLVEDGFQPVFAQETSLQELDLRKNNIESPPWAEFINKLKAAVPKVLLSHDM